MKKRWILILTVLLLSMTGIRIHSEESVYTMMVKVVSDQGVPLQGAQFYVYKDGAYDCIVESDASGCVRLENLTWGTYVLSQQVSSYGYDCMKKDIEFVIDENSAQQGTLKDIVNKKLIGNLHLRLVDQDGKALSKKSITLMNAQGKLIRTITSDKKGNADIAKVEVGSYHIQLKDTEKEYAIDKELSIEVTPFNYDRKDTITLHLHSLKQTRKSQDYSFVIFFICALLAAAGYGIYFFRKHSITQFLDDFMV